MYIYVCIQIKSYIYVTIVNFFTENSALYSARKCSDTTGQCTVKNICSRDEACGSKNKTYWSNLAVTYNKYVYISITVLILRPLNAYLTVGLIIKSSCGGTHDAGEYLTSPNYPQYYEYDMDCRWTVTAPVGSIIRLNFRDFYTYNYFDALSIYEGTNIHGPLITTLRDYAYEPFSSPGNAIYLKFSSDNYGSLRGFKIKVDAVGMNSYWITIC